MEDRELNDILLELERRKSLSAGDEHSVRMIPPGIQEIEDISAHLNKASANLPPSVTYNVNIHGPNYGGVQQGGKGKIKNVSLTNDSGFDNAIKNLLELTRTSSLPDDEIEEIQDEITKISKLALKDPAPGLLERVKSRIDVIKVGIQGTDLLIKAGPHLETVWHYLSRKFGGNLSS